VVAVAKDLRSFLQEVRALGPDFYVELSRPVKPKLEVTVIQQKLTKAGRHAVVSCPRVEGSDIPLVTNLFGSYALLGLALGLDPRSVSKAEVLPEFRRREGSPQAVKEVSKEHAPVKQVVLPGEEVDLDLLPVPQHAEFDSGKYLTVACTICRDPDTGIPNAGVYRMEVRGKQQVSLMANPVHDFAHIAKRHAELGRKMDVVVAIGHHPAMILGALTKGRGVDLNELEIMGGLLGEPLRVTSAESVDLPVPADAEIILEGVVDPKEIVQDGPLGEFTGYYGGKQAAWLIRLTSMAMRQDATYMDLAPGHREHALALILPSEAAVYDVVQRAVPSVKAVHLPPYAGSLFHLFISIDKHSPGEGKVAGMAGCVAEPNAKFVVVVDKDIDIYDVEDVMWAVATRVGSDRNMTMINEAMGSHLDPTARDENGKSGGVLVTKMIVDATLPVGSPFPPRVLPPRELWDQVRLEDYLR
jgi:2,5-furandicarboxylate decarboxylase 1